MAIGYTCIYYINYNNIDLTFTTVNIDSVKIYQLFPSYGVRILKVLSNDMQSGLVLGSYSIYSSHHKPKKNLKTINLVHHIPKLQILILMTNQVYFLKI